MMGLENIYMEVPPQYGTICFFFSTFEQIWDLSLMGKTVDIAKKKKKETFLVLDLQWIINESFFMVRSEKAP